MSGNKVGVFDSGLGGLTVLRAFDELCPSADLVYFGDTARVPYGTRENSELRIFASQNVELLKRHGANGVIAACGTVSSLLTSEEFSSFGIPFSGVVSAAATAAAKRTVTGRIGVLGTAATVRNRGFKKDILAIRPDAEISYMACTDFVPLAERGIFNADDPELSDAVDRYLKPLMENEPDVIILGCTHYPLLSDAIRRVTGSTCLIDVSRETVKAFCRQNSVEGSGTREYYVSGDPEFFKRTAEKLLGHPIPIPNQERADQTNG